MKRKIADLVKQSVDQISLSFGDVALDGGQEKCLVGSLSKDGDDCNQTWSLKNSESTTLTSSSSLSTALVTYDAGASSKSAMVTDKAASSGTCSSAPNEDVEKALPGVVMASGGKVFSMLYQLANLDDTKTMQQIRKLMLLMPTDPAICDALDAIRYSSTNDSFGAASASPKLSPRTKKVSFENVEETRQSLEKLFDAGAENMSPFRVLYNLEVLSSRLMPTKPEDNALQFSQDFLNVGGLRCILNVFERESLPVSTDYDIRQRIYLVALQIVAHLLCGQAVVKGACQGSGQIVSYSQNPSVNPVTASPVMKPTPPKKSALDSSVAETLGKSPIAVSASKIVQTMIDMEFRDTVSCLVRVVWAAAAGNLRLASSSSLGSAHNDQQASRFFASRRSRDSSTGSSGSTGSDGTSCYSEVLHAGICAQQKTVSAGDSQIAGQAFDLLITCLQLRNNNMNYFYDLPLVQDFVIDTLLGSPGEEVRVSTCEQLMKLSKTKLTNRVLDFQQLGSSPHSSSSKPMTPKHFLTKVIISTPVALWMPSCKARGISHAILGQCTEYFELRCYLLRGLTRFEQETFDIDIKQMVEDELTFLHNFTPCNRLVDCTLIAGHLRLVEALLTCDGVDKKEVGTSLIPEILNTYLFPSSKLISDGALNNHHMMNLGSKVTSNPKCDTSDSRVAAYSLLVELSKNCVDNTAVLTSELIKLHHKQNDDLIKEFEFEPPIERRVASNFVGLKNAGATCYMNSVLQQLYGTPGVNDKILSVEFDRDDDETVFYQLQNVFGHLMESKLKYYTPEKFWKCFRLFGRPVNVRELARRFRVFHTNC